MSDIFQEVEEDLRREKLKRAWDRYGIYVLGVAVLIVLITAGYRGYEAWQTSRARSNGDVFIAALDKAASSETVTPAQELVTFAEDAPGGYAMLAQFRAASAFAQAGELDRAREIFSALSTDGDIPALYQNLARVRLAGTLIDQGDIQQAQQTLAPMAEDTSNPFSSAAQELMGLTAYMSDDIAGARRWYGSVRDEAGAPEPLRTRARMMLALMEQSSAQGGDGSEATAAEETN